MKSSDELYQLIATLSRLERGYFSKYAAIHVKGEENNYKKLFDILCNMPEYSEAALRKKLKGDPMLGYLATAKNQLYHTILKTLRPYYEDYRLESKLCGLSNDVQLLKSKGLAKQARKQNQKLKVMCNMHEKHQFELLAIRQYIPLIKNEDASGKEIAELFSSQRKLQEEALQKTINTINFENCYTDLQIRVREIGLLRSIDDEVLITDCLSHPLLKSDQNCLTATAKTYFNCIRGCAAKLYDQHELALKHYLKAEQLIKGKSDLTHKFPELYVDVLKSICQIYLGDKKEKETQLYLTKLKRLPSQYSYYKTLEQRSRIVYTTSVLELEMWHALADYKKAAEQVAYLESELAAYEKGSPLLYKLEFNLRAAVSYFCVSDFRKAWTYLQKVIIEKYEIHNREFVNFVRLFYLLIHFELENHEHLFYALRSTQRKFEKQGPLPIAEKLLFHFLRTNSNLNKRMSNLYPVARLHEEFQLLNEDAYQKRGFYYLSIPVWIESKYRAISMQKVAQEKVRPKTYSNKNRKSTLREKHVSYLCH